MEVAYSLNPPVSTSIHLVLDPFILNYTKSTHREVSLERSENDHGQ